MPCLMVRNLPLDRTGLHVWQSLQRLSEESIVLEYLLQLAAEGPDTISNRTFPLFRDFGKYPGLHLGILVDDS